MMTHSRWVLARTRALALVAMAVFACLTLSCTKKGAGESSDDGGNDGGNQPVLKYIKLRVVCNDNGEHGMVVGIRIFDERTHTRLVLGSTDPAGYFCSGRKYDIAGSYRIEYYQYPEDKCILWVKNIRYSEDPIWFSDNCSNQTEAVSILGTYGYDFPALSDCWEH